MKKILTTLAIGAMLATAASADFSRIEMGVGAWQQTPSGVISYTESGVTAIDKSDEVEETSAYVWMLIKHPIPIVPNLRLEYTSIESAGTVSGKFEDFEIPAGETTISNLEMTQYDIIPYYNILDNTAWTTLDLGLDLKVVDTSYTADAKASILFDGYSDSVTIVIPLVYARVRVEIPATSIGIESDVKYITYDGSTIYDVRVKVDYTMDFIPVIQPAIEVGYRVQKFDIVDSDEKAKTDLEFTGVYAGLMLRF